MLTHEKAASDSASESGSRSNYTRGQSITEARRFLDALDAEAEARPAAAFAQAPDEPLPHVDDLAVTNAEFLAALAPPLEPEERLWCCHFAVTPAEATEKRLWGGFPLVRPAPDTPDRNSYFSVATLRPDAKGEHHRRKENFGRLWCVVLDDPTTLQGAIPPTWILQTSHNKVQVGYKLADPVADLGIARRLHQALTDAGHLGADTNGNNPVRYVRLPVGSNTKRNPPHRHRLTHWAPEVSETLDILIAGLGLDADAILNPPPEPPRAPVQPTLTEPAAWAIKAERIALDAALRTVNDPKLGRHQEIYSIGCRAARDGLPPEALEPALQAFAARMRPCDTNGVVTGVNWGVERQTIRDGYRTGTTDGIPEQVDSSGLTGQANAAASASEAPVETNPHEAALGPLAARGAGVSRPEWDRDRVLGALAYLDPTQYLGMGLRALHHASGGGLDGLDLVGAWLGADGADDTARVEAAWLALDPHPKKPITLRSIYKDARTQGWDGQPYRPPPPPLALVDLRTMRHMRPPPRYALDRLIPRELVTLLGAHGGAGKSMLALTIAAHVCCGRAWAGHSAVTGRTLYVTLEDSGAMVLDRLGRIVDAFGLDADAVTQGMTVLDGTGGDSALAIERPFARDLAPTRLLREVSDAAIGSALVVIDNASDAFAGDENNRVQVRGFMRMLGDIARRSGAGVLLLAHVDKAAAKYGALGNSYSGSTAWHNSARSRLALTEREGVIELAQEKLTVSKKADPVVLSWTDTGVLIPGTAGADAARAIIDASEDRAILACMQAAAEAGATVPTGETGPATTWHALSVYAECPERLRTNKPQFRAAVARVLRAGLIVRETYVNAARNSRERYVLTNSDPASVRVSSNQRGTDANQRPPCVSSTHRGVGIEATQNPAPSNQRKTPAKEERRHPWET